MGLILLIMVGVFGLLSAAMSFTAGVADFWLFTVQCGCCTNAV